ADLSIGLKPGRASVPALDYRRRKQAARRLGEEWLSVHPIRQLRSVLRDDHGAEVAATDLRHLRCSRHRKDHPVLPRSGQNLALQPLKSLGEVVRLWRWGRSKSN